MTSHSVDFCKEYNLILSWAIKVHQKAVMQSKTPLDPAYEGNRITWEYDFYADMPWNPEDMMLFSHTLYTLPISQEDKASMEAFFERPVEEIWFHEQHTPEVYTEWLKKNSM